MGFTKEAFPTGTHMCYIYNDEKERRKIISKFLEGGFDAEEKVAYFADLMPPEEVKKWLSQLGVKVT